MCATVGLGKEVGTAVDSSLGAISNRTNEFAQTPVGKLTVAVVIFKVIGDTAVHIIVGITEVIVLIPLWIWSYRKYVPGRVVQTEERNEKGKVVKRTFTDKIIRNNDEWLSAHWFALVGIAAVVLFTVFSY